MTLATDWRPDSKTWGWSKESSSRLLQESRGRDDGGGLGQCRHGGGGKKWLDSGCTLKVKPTAFAGTLGAE